MVTANILIAEDAEINYIFLERILEDYYKKNKFSSTKIYHAKNGQEAVDKVNKLGKNLDLILMDIRMPIMDGIQATKLIRKNNPNLPVIAISANFNIYTNDESDDLFDYKISKPININRLESILSTYLIK